MSRLISILALVVLSSACLPGGGPTSENGSDAATTAATEELPTGEHASGQPDNSPIERADLGEVLSEPNDLDHLYDLDRIPGRVTGFYDGERDVDAVVLDTDRLRQMGATTVEVSPVPGMRPILRLLDGDSPERVELAAWRAERPGQGAGVPNLGPIDDVVRVILEVSEVDGRSDPRPYTLSLHRPEPREADLLELEPNDDPGSAGRIDRSATVAGFFHNSQDRDVFSLVLADETAVTAILRPDAWTDGAIRWQLGGEDEVTQDFEGVGGVEQVCARLLAPGEHLLEIDARSGEMSRLSEYELAVRFEGDGFEREPNDHSAGETLQLIETELRGYIESPSDVDVFGLRLFGTVDLSPAQVIEVAPPPDVDVAVEVLDDEGGSVTARTDQGGRGHAERVSVPRVYMTYRVVVSSGRQGGTSCESPYRIHLPPE